MSTTDGSAVTGAQVVAETLVQAGVSHVFGLPGTTVMDLIDAIGEHDDIRYVSVRHEQAAAHMADGYWRGTGRLSACLVSRGPGAANLAIGVHNAYAESIPMLVLIGQVPNRVAHRDAFEEMDVVDLFEPMAKWSFDINRVDRLRELIGRAIGVAVSGRPRPVAVSLPLDVIQESTTPHRDVQSSVPRYPRPDSGGLSDAIDLLSGAERPVIILGGGMLAPDHHSRGVLDLASALPAPVVTTWLRKNAFPNSNANYVGTLGYGSHRAAERALEEADVALALGCRFSEFTTKRYTLPKPGIRLIHVDVDPVEIGAIVPAAIGIVSDGWQTAEALAGLVDGVPKRTYSWLEELRLAYESETKAVEMREDAPGVQSGAVIDELQRFIRRHDPVIVQDTHTFGPWIARHVEFERPGTYYGAAGGAMGWGLPAAIGVKAGRPGETVVAICSDGSFWMVAQDLETAIREDLPIVAIVINNFSYGNTRDRQKYSHAERYHGVFVNNPDFARWARLLGATGERVERADQLEPALDAAVSSGGCAVVDIIQDKHEGLPSDLRPISAR